MMPDHDPDSLWNFGVAILVSTGVGIVLGLVLYGAYVAGLGG